MLASVIVTPALVAVLLLVPGTGSVHATDMVGQLRAPGEAAFIAAHRGDRASAPENTMEALTAALDAGMEFVETDVQLSSDGVAVLIHDETVDRTTDGTGAVARLTASELRALDAGSWYAPEFAGAQIPLLGEFLDALARSESKALLELKGYWPRDEIRQIVAELHLRVLQDRIVLGSFNLTTVAHLAEAAPGIPRVIIKRDLPSDPVGLAEYYDAIGIVTTPNSLELDPDAVERMHSAGLAVLVYTLNTEKRWSDAVASGVDGIITDKPSKLDGWIAETAPGT